MGTGCGRGRFVARVALGLVGCLVVVGLPEVPLLFSEHAVLAGPPPTGHYLGGWGVENSSLSPYQSNFPEPGPLSDVASISAGAFTDLTAQTDNFVVAAKSDGSVWAWGDNTFGQLGNGGTTASTTPAQVPGVSGIVQVAAGGGFVLALGSDGTVWSWGNNSLGQLGNGNSSGGSSPTPAQVPGLSGITQVAAGGYFGLAVGSDGTVWSWGDNSLGQLGNGDTSGSPSATPAKVTNPDGSTFSATSVTAGLTFALAVRSDQTVWGWGEDATDQLGDPSGNTAYNPEQVQGISQATAVAASGGTISSNWQGTGVSFALRTDGTVWAWGDDSSRELGDPGFGNPPNPTPAAVPGVAGAVAIAAENDDTAANFSTLPGEAGYAVLSDGTAVSWGGFGENEIDGRGPVNGPARQVPDIREGRTIATGDAIGMVLADVPIGPAADETLGRQNAGECTQGAVNTVPHYPVNIMTGNFTQSVTDLTVPGRGIPLTLTRTYNSALANGSTGLGNGWSFNYGMGLNVLANGDAVLTQENGAQVTFYPTTNGFFQSTERVTQTLKGNSDGTYTLTRPNGDTFAFSSTGLLQSEADRNGNPTTLTYGNNGGPAWSRASPTRRCRRPAW
jgi:hypothetical protein